jgi:hypothetical protein
MSSPNNDESAPRNDSVLRNFKGTIEEWFADCEFLQVNTRNQVVSSVVRRFFTKGSTEQTGQCPQAKRMAMLVDKAVTFCHEADLREVLHNIVSDYMAYKQWNTELTVKKIPPYGPGGVLVPANSIKSTSDEVTGGPTGHEMICPIFRQADMQGSEKSMPPKKKFRTASELRVVTKANAAAALDEPVDRCLLPQEKLESLCIL